MGRCLCARFAAVTRGPAWSLPAFLAIALALRLPAVFCAHGFEYVDQQYQYVDPAWHLATGEAWHRTWEWRNGLRSVVYPQALAFVFRAGIAIVGDDPIRLMQFVRAVDALVSLLPMWLWWLCVVRWRPLAAPRLPLLLLAGSGLVVGFSVRPSGPGLAAVLALASAIAVHGPRAFPALGGLCLGLAFCCRAQEAVFGPALLAVLLGQRRWLAAAAFSAACLPGILTQGFVDVAMTGRFLGSVWNYVEGNLVHGAAAKWQGQPFWFYFVAGVLPVLALVPPYWRHAWTVLTEGAKLLPGAAAAAALHLLVFSCIGRKALRFEWAALAMLLAVLAAGLGANAALQSWQARWHRRVLVLAHAGWLLFASFWIGNAGAMRLALAMRALLESRGEIVVVGGDASTIGGFYYLRPEADRVRSVPREGLVDAFANAPPPPGTLVVTAREPLAEDSLQRLGRLELVARFTGFLDVGRGYRRYLYRWR